MSRHGGVWKALESVYPAGRPLSRTTSEVLTVFHCFSLALCAPLCVALGVGCRRPQRAALPRPTSVYRSFHVLLVPYFVKPRSWPPNAATITD